MVVVGAEVGGADGADGEDEEGGATWRGVSHRWEPWAAWSSQPRRMATCGCVGVIIVGVMGIVTVSIGEGEGGGFVVACGGGEFEGAGEDFEEEAEGVVGGREGDDEAEDAEGRSPSWCRS